MIDDTDVTLRILRTDIGYTLAMHYGEDELAHTSMYLTPKDALDLARVLIDEEESDPHNPFASQSMATVVEVTDTDTAESWIFEKWADGWHPKGFRTPVDLDTLNFYFESSPIFFTVKVLS